MMSNVERLADLRLALADARAELRTRQDYWHAARLRAELVLGEQWGYDNKKPGFTNAEDRKRAFDAAVEGDPDCHSALSHLRTMEDRVGRLEAELDSALDERRDHEWRLRERSLDAMGVLTGIGDQYGVAL